MFAPIRLVFRRMPMSQNALRPMVMIFASFIVSFRADRICKRKSCSLPIENSLPHLTPVRLRRALAPAGTWLSLLMRRCEVVSKAIYFVRQLLF
jgi:hypothetical protein